MTNAAPARTTISDATHGDTVELPALGEITIMRITHPTAGALHPRVRIDYTADWMAFGSQIVYVLADTPARFLDDEPA